MVNYRPNFWIHEYIAKKWLLLGSCHIRIQIQYVRRRKTEEMQQRKIKER